MTDEVLKPVELGFAEFVAKLISDVFDATIGAQAEQNEKLAELEALLQQPEQAFVDSLLAKPEFVSEIDKLLASVLPVDGERAHTIYEGAEYQSETANQKEQPPLKEVLGYEVQKGDLKPRTKQLSEQGVLNIYRHVAAPAASKKRDILLKMLENGLPNIVVDKGKINAKLTFNTSLLASNETDSGTSGDVESGVAASNLSATNATATSSVSRAATVSLSESLSLRDRLTVTDRLIAPIQPIDRFVGLIKPDIKDQVRLTVKQASNKSPQDTQATANIFSEVEIHFKTIS